MSVTTLYSRAQMGIEAPLVTVEVHLSPGLPAMSIVGLPEAAVKESKDRVRAAILNSNYTFPIKRITVNLAPADLPKKGGRFDLAIALGILIASEQVLPKGNMKHYEILGELALNGELRTITGILPAALQCQQQKRALLLPYDNAKEACLAEDLVIYPAHSLAQICAHLNQAQNIEVFDTPEEDNQENEIFYGDLADVKGQYRAKRALEIAAAGGHNLLFIGPPGTGKTMLASRLPGILPPMLQEEALKTAAVYSISHHGFDVNNWKKRPFRAPHHTVSAVALIGGGTDPKPGEVSLANHGVLFLDELLFFNKKALEVLREPLEVYKVTISRAARQAEFPADFQLIAALNPYPDGKKTMFGNQLSAPLLDRIDMQIEVPPVPKEYLRPGHTIKQETSFTVQQRVIKARMRQIERAGKINARLNSKEIDAFCYLGEQELAILEQAMDKYGFSARGQHRILKVARTIADLAEKETIALEHLTEALTYRQLEKMQG